MRILILSQYFTPEVGATQTRMHQFAKNLVAKGHKVRVICEFPNHPKGIIPPEYDGKMVEKTELDGFSVTRLRVVTSPKKTFLTRLLFYLSYMFFSIFAGIFTKEKYDIVFATSPPLFVAISGYIVSFFKRAKFVLDIRDLWPAAAVALGELNNPTIVRVAEVIELFLYRKANIIIAVTKGFAAYIEALGIDAKKIYRIANGTVEELFFPVEKNQKLKEEIGARNNFLVTFAGNHGIAQGLETVISAASLLKKEDVNFLLIGDGPVKAKLKKIAAEKGISNIIFHGQVPLDEIRNYIAISDAMLVPLINDRVFDTFIPSKLFDFMACGKAVILSVDGEAREILEQSKGGLFCKQEDPVDLSEKILFLKNNRKEQEKMGENGRKFVLSNFTRKKQALELEKILTKLTVN